MPRPRREDVMKRADAKDVLDANGRTKRHGPHIHPNPVMYRDGIPIPLDSAAEQPIGEGFVGAAAPMLVIQAEPSDLGAAQNLWANPLWTIPASSLQVANQGPESNCYHLAAQGQLLDTVPWYLQACVAKVAPNFVDVTYRRNRTAPVTYRTTGMLGNHLRPDARGSTGCCYVEKTFAMERTGANTYASTSWGSPGTVLGDLGVGSIYLYPAAPSFLTALLAARANNKGLSCLTKGTIAAGIPIIGSHAYVVIDVVVTGPGPLDYVMTLRNVWGFDGIGNDGNPADGLVKLTGAQVLAGISAVCQATDLAPDVMPPADPTATLPDPMPPAVPVSPPEKPMISLFPVVTVNGKVVTDSSITVKSTDVVALAWASTNADDVFYSFGMGEYPGGKNSKPGGETSTLRKSGKIYLRAISATLPEVRFDVDVTVSDAAPVSPSPTPTPTPATRLSLVLNADHSVTGTWS